MRKSEFHRPTTAPLNVRFWEKVNKTDDCWNWIGCKDKCGYGQIRHNGRTSLAHRVSWILHQGSLAKNICVLHKCDNPSCVNPEHLFLGTHRDNLDDMVRKGRSSKTAFQGIDHPSCRLTENDVLEIRNRRKCGEKLKTIAESFGISLSHAGNIANGKSWSHL